MRNLQFVMLGLISSGAAFADISVWVGGDIGVSDGLINADYQQQAKDAGLNTVIGSVNDQRMNGSLALGLDINPLFESSRSNAWPIFLTTELEYFDMGKVDLEYSGNSTASEQATIKAEMLKIHPKSGNGGALSLITRISPLADLKQWQLGMRLGGTYWQQEYQLVLDDTASGTESLSGVGGLLGLQTSYQLTGYLLAKVEWKIQQFDQEFSHSGTLGFEFRPMALLTNAEMHKPVEKESAKLTPSAVPSPTITLIPQPSTVVTPTLAVISDLVALFPEGKDDQMSVAQNASVVMDVLANDASSEGLYISRFEGGSEGRVSFSDGENEYGQLKYQHAGGIQADDVVYYWLMDGMSGQESEAIAVNLKITDISLPTEFNLNILFSPGSRDIDEKYYAALNQYALLLSQNMQIISTIEGHTDSYGDMQLNLALSEQRAKAIADYLITKGISPQRLTVKGYGDQLPIADNLTAEGRSLNRRIVVSNNIQDIE